MAEKHIKVLQSELSRVSESIATMVGEEIAAISNAPAAIVGGTPYTFKLVGTILYNYNQ